MKTLKHYLGALRLAFIGAIALVTNGPFSASLGAKSGTITSPTGSDANMRTLGDTSPARDTLAGIVRAAFQLATALKIGIIDFFQRKAIVLATGTNIASVAAEGVLVATLVKDDPTKASSPWTATAGAGAAANPTVATAIDELIATRKPSISVESLNNGVEDIAEDLALALDNTGLFSVIDQASGEVKVYAYNVEDDNPADAAIALAEEAQFVQTLDAAGGTQFGE